MKVLLSTYSCLPGKTSEAGNAWRTINECLREHEVWAVIERGHRHEESIRRHLAEHPMPGFHPVFFELPPPIRWGRGRGPWEAVYYHQWQARLADVVRELHGRIGFDMAHHVTYGRYWSPSGLRVLDIPFIWGPVGTAETPPRSFVSELPLRSRIFEAMRDGARNWSVKTRALVDTAKAATIGIGVTPESCAALRQLGVRRVEQMPQTAMTDEDLNLFGSLPPPPAGPFRAIGIGRMLHWKGFHLAIRAFARFAKTNPDAELWLINNGPFRGELEKIAAAHGVSSQVRFWGHLGSYEEVLQKLGQAHVLMHPALHEGFGNVCLEAMAAGRPVVCLDIGGPAAQITPETGFAAPATNPEEAVAAMAAFLEKLNRDRALLAKMSANAKARVQAEFTMQKFNQTMRSYYQAAIASHQQFKNQSSQPTNPTSSSPP